MHTQSMDNWRHAHVFLGDRHGQNERKTWLVIGLTTAMMIAEITGGSLFGSMALVADGWHMSTHAGALAISAFAYTYARRHRHDQRFAFGTGKLGDLAGFTSAIVLALIAALIIYEAVQRLLVPVPIAFGEALSVAALALSVNLASAWLLRDDEHHRHDAHADHDHGHAHGATRRSSRHHDNNLRSAYLHVVADAATSVLAIIGLMAGWFFGWIWMDAVMGMVGALVIVNWSYSLVRDTGRVLLDVLPDGHLAGEIRERLQADGTLIADLHLWQVGPGHYGAIVSLVAERPLPPNAYKAMLGGLDALSHVTIEVHPCEGHAHAERC